MKHLFKIHSIDSMSFNILFATLNINIRWFFLKVGDILVWNWNGRDACHPSVQFSQFNCSVVSDCLRPHESQHARPPCSSPSPGVHSDSRPSSQWCHPAISSSAVPFSSCPQSLPASESFPVSQLFSWGGQSTGVSALASFLPRNPRADLQNGLVGSPCSPRDSQESSPAPQFKSINSSALSFLHSPTLTSIHDHWKNHSFDYTDLRWQSSVSAFQYAI